MQYSGVKHSVDSEPVLGEAAQQEPTPKKRKRATKAVAEPVFEPIAASADSPAESALRKPDEIDVFDVPVPTAAEAQLLTQFSKRNKTAQARYPSIAGLPYLVYDGSIKLPGAFYMTQYQLIPVLTNSLSAPKSYDKLAPLIALPPRSGKQMVPELGYNLPCELQGRFTSQYRPSPNKIGLDERRDEAKSLLDEFDRSMNALGKRRPKYTEYPRKFEMGTYPYRTHSYFADAFKEQLKSDEASKNKAEKKAKKEQEEERNKPVSCHLALLFHMHVLIHVRFDHLLVLRTMLRVLSGMRLELFMSSRPRPEPAPSSQAVFNKLVISLSNFVEI